VDDGELRIRYDDGVSGIVEYVGEVASEAARCGGSREKREGEGEINERY
jgi:hypothetical protein